MQPVFPYFLYVFYSFNIELLQILISVSRKKISSGNSQFYKKKKKIFAKNAHQNTKTKSC